MSSRILTLFFVLGWAAAASAQDFFTERAERMQTQRDQQRLMERSVSSLDNIARSIDATRIPDTNARLQAERANMAAAYGLQSAMQMNAMQQNALQQSLIQQNVLRLEVIRLQKQIKELEKDLKLSDADRETIIDRVKLEDNQFLSKWLTALLDTYGKPKNPQTPSKKVIVTFEPA